MKAYACKAWKQLTDTGNELTDLPTLNKQDALTVEEDELVAVEPVVAVVAIVNIDVLLDVNENEDCGRKGAVGLDELEPARLKHKLRKMLDECRAKELKVLTFVAETFTLAKELLESAYAHPSRAEHAAGVSRGKKLRNVSVTVTDEQHGRLKALADAQVKRTRRGSTHKLDEPGN